MLQRAGVRLTVAVALCIGLYGCSEEIEGPSPQLPEPADGESTFEPGFVCNEQIEEWVTVTGSDFGPLVVDALEDSRVDYPKVSLVRARSIEGDATDDGFEVTLTADDDPDQTQVRWTDSETLAFRVTPDLELEPGSYDVVITNPNGESATAAASFGVLPRPSVSGVEPDMACVAQSERSIEVEGDHFLIDAGSTPTVQIGDNTYDVDSAEDCRALHADAFGSHEVCRSLTVTVGEEDFDAGTEQIAVHNIEPAACSSLPAEDDVELLVVDPPSVAGVDPTPICSEQVDHEEMTVSGDNFIVVTDGDAVSYPTVRVGGQAYQAHAASDCQAIEGLSNQSAERCSQLTFEIPADDQAGELAAGERSGDVDIVVENPQPAGCTSTESVAVTVVPPPSVDDAQPEPVCVADEGKQVTVTGFGFLRIDSAVPQVQVGDQTYDADSLTACEAITIADEPDLSVESCDELTFTLPLDAVNPDANHDIVVINPEHAHCQSTQHVQYYVAGRPAVTNVSPQPVCTADGDNVMLVEGDNFLEITETDGTDHWPTVTIGPNAYEAANIGDCTDAPLQDDGMQRPTRICTSLEVVVPQGDLDPGDHTVSVTNPLEADCTSADTSDLNVVPPPTLTSITEEIACVEQGAESFVVEGTDILAIDGAQPSVEIAGNTYDAQVDDTTCTTTDVNGRTVQTCTELSFTVPEGDLAAGVLDVTVSNPDSAACASTNTLELTINPAPTVSAVEPNPVCSSAGATIEVVGSDFLVDDGDTPTVTIDGQTYTSSADTANDCTQLGSVTSRTVYSCTRLSVDVLADDLTDGAHVVEVANPDPVGCSSTDTTSLVAMPAPTVAAIDSDILCNETAEATATITGSGFAKTDSGELPAVTIGGEPVQTIAANGCSPVAGTTIESCDELEVLASTGTLTEGSGQVVVENPGGGGCSSDGTTSAEVFGVAQVDSVDPSFYCDQTGGTELTVEGTNFFVVDGNTPEVEIDSQTFATTVDAANCTSVHSRVDSCTSLIVTIPEPDLNPGTYDLSVINPAPLACPSSNTSEVVEAGAPTITGALPDPLCSSEPSFVNDGTVTLTGTDFLVIDSNLPTASVNGVAATVDSVDNCSAVTNPDYTIESCTELTLSVPASERDGDFDVDVQNPAPAACGDPASFTVAVEQAPVVTSVTPLRICQDGGSFQIDGEHFDPNMTVELGGVSADSVTVNAAGTSATADFSSPPPRGEYDLTVTNPSTCSETFDQQVKVVVGPTVFYVDPPVAYNGINTQVIIYLSGLEGGSISDVTLHDSAGNATQVDFNFDPNRPNTVQATVPGGILDQGMTTDDFSVEVTDDVDCSGTGQDLLTVTDELTVAIDAIDPTFGWTDSSTAVKVSAVDPAPAGQQQFVATPRAYLNPVGAGANTLATELRSLQFIDETEIDGIVPSGMPVGEYDVIVVNPDGSVGLLTDANNDPTRGAFEITQDPPPLVDSVSPGSWINGENALPVTIEGEHFRDPLVEVFCQDGSTRSINPATFTATQIDMTVDTNNMDHLTVCYIVVTNTDNGTFAEYSPITVTNPAGNFITFNPGEDLNVARRSLAMSSGVPSRTAKFIYAIGGDDGDEANGHASMEFSQIDRFGQPRAWQIMPAPHNLAVPQNELPDELTHSLAVRIRDFIYLVGGYESATGPTDKVLRANVLDPLDVPNITNLELTFAEGTPGNDPGTYYYRVSAILDPGAAHNPGGETLASEPQPVSVPLNSLRLELTWETFPDAVEYRVYRTADPDQVVGTEELLAVVPAPAGGGPVTYVDDGTDTITPDANPLPLGSLGAWHQPDDTNGDPLALEQARYHHGVTSAPSPNSTDEFFVYAVAGGDGTDVYDDYEYFQVNVGGPRDQTLSPTSRDTTNVLATPRWRGPAVTASNLNSNVSQPYVYMLGGKENTSLQANNGITRQNEAAAVNADGTLGAWQIVANNQRDRWDYAAGVANNNVVVAGGGNASTDTNADHSEICNPTLGCAEPQFENWKSLSQVDLRSRALHGYVSFNGFFYVTGGYSVATGDTLETTDFSVMGGTP